MPRRQNAKVDKKHEQEQQAQIQGALRWSGAAPEPDVPPPTAWKELRTGYVFNVYTQRVDVACSDTISHSVGRTDKVTSQQPISMYSTRKLALVALRCAMEQKFAEQLAAIDRQIDQESKV